MATQIFVPDVQKSCVQGLVLVGLVDLKAKLTRLGPFDQKFHKIVIKMMDISYGGEKLFNQAIEYSLDTLGTVMLMKEKEVAEEVYGRD